MDIEESKSVTSLIDTTSLDQENIKIANDIISESNVDKVKDFTRLFNLNNSKKNVLRVMKYNELLDSVSDVMIDRFNNRSHEFTNKELLDYMTAFQSAIEKSNKQLELIDTSPAIALTQNNTNVNINVENTLNRESRERVMDVVNSILRKASCKNDINNIEDETVLTEITEEDTSIEDENTFSETEGDGDSFIKNSMFDEDL